MAALRARRLAGASGDGVDDRADLLGLGAELADGLGGASGGRAQARIAATPPTPWWRPHGQRAGLLGAGCVAVTWSADA
jgi:hypothetical protein